MVDLDVRCYSIPSSKMQGIPGHELFDFLAECIQQAIASTRCRLPDQCSVPAAFAFAFGINLAAIDAGTLFTWSSPLPRHLVCRWGLASVADQLCGFIIGFTRCLFHVAAFILLGESGRMLRCFYRDALAVRMSVNRGISVDSQTVAATWIVPFCYWPRGVLYFFNVAVFIHIADQHVSYGFGVVYS